MVSFFSFCAALHGIFCFLDTNSKRELHLIMRFDLQSRRKGDVLSWGCGLFESIFHFFAVLYSSQGPQKVTILLSAEFQVAKRNHFRSSHSLLLCLKKIHHRSWFICWQKLNWNLCRVLSGSGESYELEGKWSTWMARLLPSGKLQAHAELTPHDTLLILQGSHLSQRQKKSH